LLSSSLSSSSSLLSSLLLDKEKYNSNNDNMELLKNKRFNTHPDFKKGIDIWEIKIPETCKIENDQKSDTGYFTKEILGNLDADLVKSFEWMDAI
jgi:hypothetical protein